MNHSRHIVSYGGYGVFLARRQWFNGKRWEDDEFNSIRVLSKDELASVFNEDEIKLMQQGSHLNTFKGIN